jgi:hypothetical protein
LLFVSLFAKILYMCQKNVKIPFSRKMSMWPGEQKYFVPWTTRDTQNWGNNFYWNKLTI